ncbi:MAG: leucine-rich repeat domain-containing protein, partial [Muribaculaceae bacterium]|nr:leucine-rich repeat domain-containing protein [Muribaculaceae bacterium]
AFTGSHITQLNLPDHNNGIELSAYCFSNVTGLAEVKLPSVCTLVKTNSFYGCPDLLTVDFTATASGSLQIDNYAFSGCTSLSTVKFPAAIDYIGDYAFQKTSITEVNLPDANRIGNYSFAETKIVKVTWSTLPIAEFGTHIFCMTPIAEISFPAWMTRIPDAICYQCTSLTTVNLHEGVETIGRMAFGGNVSTLSMSEIKLPSTLKQIEDQAFIRQPLKQITFPDGLTSIGGSAFSNCQLSGVTVPASVKEIGPRAFASNKITSISLPEAENPAFTPISFGNYIFESNPITTYRFPAWMKSVPNGFFYKCQLTSVTFADGTYEICKDALRQNRLLEISEMPQTITHYGESCLSYCGTGLPAGRYLCSVYIGGGVQIDNMAFSSSKLREVIFTDCDYTLGDNIFMLVKSVSRIVFPECMTEIPDGICNGWENLTEVTWPPVVKHIGNQAFSGCKSLVFGRDDDGGGNVINLSEAPFEHLESIGNEAFARCNITGIIWPDENNIEIGNNLFSGISTLTQAHIPGWMDPVPDGLYKDCSNLSELIWDPSDRTSLTIGNEAFRGLGLSAIEWPDVPATFGSYAFAGNKQATEIKWPDSPVTLGTNSFYECTALTGPVSLPEYITAVPNGCFQKCTSLPEFTLHEGMTSIGQYAFSECSSLRYFTADCELEEIPFNAFSSCGQLETFKAKSTVKQINDKAFFDCKSLRVIDMPDNNGEYLTSIGVSAFENCEALESFPEIISASSKILYRAFYNTKSLKHITVPSQGTDNNGSNEHHFMNSGLEAIDIVASESNPKIRFFNNTFTNAPLRGVSYLRDDIPVNSITTLTSQTPRDTKGILMVNHDMKYRLMEAGYGDIWDIREMKTPRLKLYGDLHSTYTPGDTHNRYKAMIRWEIAESDLNENAPTVYHLRRDGVEIARIEFGVPEIRDAVAEGNINRNEPTKVFP